jgi:hypothetical protein
MAVGAARPGHRARIRPRAGAARHLPARALDDRLRLGSGRLAPHARVAGAAGRAGTTAPPSRAPRGEGADLPAGSTTLLAPLLGALFDLARERTDSGAEPAAENRAALLTLTLFASGRSLEAALPAAHEWPRPPPLRLTLAGREDFALHFLISAAIAADGTSPLSRAVGVWKEVADARDGSGFSFDDVAADRAGTRFGELARRRPRELQERLASGVDDAALMPPWSDLPGSLAEAEFRRRFGDVGAPAYQHLIAEIDRRIAALPLLR